MTTNHVVKCIQALLVTLLLGLSTSAYSQGTGVMTVETSPTGTTQVRYAILPYTSCFFGAPQTTQVTPISGGWQVTTTLEPWICLGFGPPGPPATVIVDLGNPAPGQYTVTWGFAGGPGYGARSATFTITQDGTLLLVPAIPALEPSMIALLALVLAAGLALGGRWRPWRERLFREP